MKAHKISELALLTALALIIFVIELQLPDLIPIPGVKLGLANIITVYAVYRYKAREVVMVVSARIILAAFFASRIMALLYSAAGAALCLTGMLLIKRIIPMKYIWLSSVVGAVLHNTGQIIAAVAILRSFAVVTFYPVLIISGCIAGAFTGLCAQLLIKRSRLEKIV
ncbi:Gx transporter family protein [Ruminococcus sp.]|uniref:Gx transporter family protein n=1 Tax=Ruminococcus sp. TaxID=41978 RepID=UPI0025D8B2E9|nr:Gx transporter family protein [Ruminococcus sp.]